MPFHIRDRGKRVDGTTKWQCRWSHPDNPKQIVERQFRDKDVARRWGKQMDRDAHSGMYGQPVADERTFAEVVEIWKQTCWAGLQPSTRVRYGEALKAHLLPEFGDMPAREITRERVRVYFARLVAERKPAKAGKPERPRYAPGTIRKIHTPFSAAMREALDMGLVPSNPCARMRGLPPTRAKGQIALTPDELQRVADEIDRVCAARRKAWKTVDHPGYKLPVLLAGYCGMRAGELWALRRGDVDPLRGVLHIRRAVKDAEATDPNERFGPPKNGKPRTISLPKFLREMLAEYMARPSRGGNDAEALLFVSVLAGDLVYHENFRKRYWLPAVKVLPEGRRPRFHDLRHTAASIYAAQPDASIIQLKDRLGHASIKTTVDLYSHLYDNHDEVAMDALDAVYEATLNPKVTPLREADAPDADAEAMEQ